MKIRMLTTAKGSPDGIRVFEYLQGEEYDLTKSLKELHLAENFVHHQKVAEPADKPIKETKTEAPVVTETAEKTEEAKPSEAKKSGK